MEGGLSTRVDDDGNNVQIRRRRLAADRFVVQRHPVDATGRREDGEAEPSRQALWPVGAGTEPTGSTDGARHFSSRCSGGRCPRGRHRHCHGAVTELASHFG